MEDSNALASNGLESGALESFGTVDIVYVEIEFGLQKGPVNAAALVTRGVSADEDDWSKNRNVKEFERLPKHVYRSS